MIDETSYTPDRKLWYLFGTGVRIVLIGGVLLGMSVHAAASPTNNLFTVEVVDNMMLASEAKHSLDQRLHQEVRRLEMQYALYQEAQCGGHSVDTGCPYLARSIGETYKEFLAELQSALPQVEAALLSIKGSLGELIAKETGDNMTPNELQEVFNDYGKRNRPIYNIPFHNLGRISYLIDKHKEELTKESSHGENTILLASRVYSDARETIAGVEELKAYITHHRVSLCLCNNFTPERMMATVVAVKRLLLGEEGKVALPGSSCLSGVPGEFDDSSLVIR